MHKALSFVHEDKINQRNLRSLSLAILSKYLDGMIVRNGPTYQGLTVYPVCLVSVEFEKSAEEFVTFESGLKDGYIKAYETGEMDNVRIAAGRKMGGARAIVLDGETILGGAQNRMINAGAVIAPGAECELPSSCVEVHRWDCKTGPDGEIPPDKQLFDKTDIAFGSLKRLKMKESIRSLRTDREPRPDQTLVWKHIVENFGISGANTKTLDLHDLYEFWETALAAFTPRFTVARHQVGMITFLDRYTWYADFFANNDLMFANFRKLIKAYSFDALIRLEKGVPARGKPDIEEARKIFKNLKSALLHPFKTYPGGNVQSCFTTTSKLMGTAILDKETLLHATLCSR